MTIVSSLSTRVRSIANAVSALLRRVGLTPPIVLMITFFLGAFYGCSGDPHHTSLIDASGRSLGFNWKPRSYWHGQPYAFVVRENGQLQVYSERWQREHDAGPIIAQVGTNWFPDTYGLIGKAVQIRDHSMKITAYSLTALTPTETSEIRDKYAALLRKWPGPTRQSYTYHASLMARGDGLVWSIDPAWLLHDLLFLAAACLWIRAAFNLMQRWLQGHRVKARLRLGQCPACTYDLSALRATPATTCPECGTPIPPIDAKLPIG